MIPKGNERGSQAEHWPLPCAAGDQGLAGGLVVSLGSRTIEAAGSLREEWDRSPWVQEGLVVRIRARVRVGVRVRWPGESQHWCTGQVEAFRDLSPSPAPPWGHLRDLAGSRVTPGWSLPPGS